MKTIPSLFDRNFKDFLMNAINKRYLSEYGYAKIYPYVEDNIISCFQDNPKMSRFKEDDNIRIIKSTTVDGYINLWLIGYKEYSNAHSNLINGIISYPSVYIGSSITPKPVGEKNEVYDMINIIVDTDMICHIYNEQDPYTRLELIYQYWIMIMNIFITYSGLERHYMRKYYNMRLFGISVDLYAYVKLAVVYHMHKSFTDSYVNKLIVTSEDYESNLMKLFKEKTELNESKIKDFLEKADYYLNA